MFLHNKGLETTFLLTVNNTPGVSIVLQTLNVTARARGILKHAHLTAPLASKIRLALLVVNSENLYLTAKILGYLKEFLLD